MAVQQTMPTVRKGYRWIKKSGCECSNCLWAERCLGRTWQHWEEIKDGHSDTGRDTSQRDRPST